MSLALAMKARKSVHYKHVSMSESSSLAHAESPIQSRVGFFEFRIVTAILAHSQRPHIDLKAHISCKTSIANQIHCMLASFFTKEDRLLDPILAN